MQLFPLIRFWLPNIKVVQPLELQHKLESGLKKYLRLE